MASQKISAMTAASALTGAELVPVVQGGANRRTTVAAIAAFAAAHTLFTITAVNQGTKTFTVLGDAHSPTGSIVVAASTGNDGTYTIVSTNFAAGHTTIVVSEAIPSATANGYMYQ